MIMDWHIIRLCLASLALSCLFGRLDAAFRGNDRWIWPNGNVYYRLSSTIKSDSSKSTLITEAMEHISEAAPCINFIDIEESSLNVTTFVDIVTDGDPTLYGSDSGCYAEVGYQGRRQILNLEDGIGCFDISIIKHNLMHSLGCVHEHSRPDVDEYFDIFMKNVKPGYEKNFLIEKDEYDDMDNGVYHYGTPYDMFSIMQFPARAFALNNSVKTMQPKDLYYQDIFGYSEDLSEIDMVELNLRYNCSLTAELVFYYVNSYMEIVNNRRRMDMTKLEQKYHSDQEKVNNLENLNLTQQQDRVNQLEYQSLIDKKRMTKLEGEIQIHQEKQNAYQERITNLEVQVQVDKGQRKADQHRISNLESDQKKVNNPLKISSIHQNKIRNLTEQHQTAQDRVNKLEYQSLIDKKRMTKLEDQIQVDQEKQRAYQKRFTNLEAQVQVDLGQRKADQDKIRNLESYQEKLNNLLKISVLHQNKIGNLTEQHQTDQDRVNKLEYQNLIDKKRMTNLEDQIQVDQDKQKAYQERITNLEVQFQADQDQRKADQDRISNLESLIEEIINSVDVGDKNESGRFGNPECKPCCCSTLGSKNETCNNITGNPLTTTCEIDPLSWLKIMAICISTSFLLWLISIAVFFFKGYICPRK